MELGLQYGCVSSQEQPLLDFLVNKSAGRSWQGKADSPQKRHQPAAKWLSNASEISIICWQNTSSIYLPYSIAFIVFCVF